MTESNQPSAVPVSVSKENKAKILYEHGKDALGLALAVANMQEEKTLRKVERHHQPQVGKPRPERNNRGRARNRKKRLEEVKVMITERRAETKKAKAKSRKEPKGRVHGAKITAPEDSTFAFRAVECDAAASDLIAEYSARYLERRLLE